MIIDAFPFFNELDILEIRFEELYNHVDWFVVVEANKTQCLNKKPLYFEENSKRFEKYLPKIAHVQIFDYPPDTHIWAMENYQRNKIWEGIKRIPNLSINDKIIISDCDEIMSWQNVRLGSSLAEEKAVSFPLKNCAFKLNLKVDGAAWIGPIMTKVSQLEYLSPQELRNNKDRIAYGGRECGWHFSYMGGKEQVFKKFHSCIEPFDKAVIPSFEEFSKEYDRKIQDRGSFLFSDKKDDSIRLSKFSADELPECVYLTDKYKHLLV